MEGGSKRAEECLLCICIACPWVLDGIIEGGTSVLVLTSFQPVYVLSDRSRCTLHSCCMF